MTLYAPIDVHFSTDPKIMAAGINGELLYLRAVLFCREHKTDGVIDPRHLPTIARGIPRARRLTDMLVTVGLWEPFGDGWRIPERVWQRYNPTVAQMRAKQAAQAEQKRLARAAAKDGQP